MTSVSRKASYSVTGIRFNGDRLSSSGIAGPRPLAAILLAKTVHVASGGTRYIYELFCQPLSIAEMRLKEEVKKKSFLADDLVDGLEHLGYKELPLTSTAANDITRFPELHHHDPFDRLLLAQAATHNLLFITADRTLVNLDVEFVHDAYT